MLAVVNTAYGAFSSDLYHLLSLSFVNSDMMAAEILLNRNFRKMYILQTKFETVCTAWSANISRACCEGRRRDCNYNYGTFIFHSVTFITFLRSKLLHSFVKLCRPFYWIDGYINSRFSPVMLSKLKIVTVQWIKSRIWNTIDDWYINNIAKNQVFAVFHLRVICKSVSPKFRELCMEKPCLCPSEGHKYGGRKVTETSVTEFCQRNEKLLL